MESPTWRQSLGNTYTIPHFLHGALADPKTLRRVFELSEEPRLKKARILGYRRVRRVNNWVLVPEKIPSEALLKSRLDKPKQEHGVEGVVYNIASTAEAHRLEKHAQAEYGAGSYATIAVEIEILAHGARRARNIAGQTIVYTGGGVAVNDEDNEKITPAKDRSAKILKAKELARKPLPYRSYSHLFDKNTPLPRSPSLNFASEWVQAAARSVNECMPRSPSLNLANVAQRPADYHGASLRGTRNMISERGADLGTTSDDIMRSLNEEIAMAYNDWKGVSRSTVCDLDGQKAQNPSPIQEERSTLKEKRPEDLGFCETAPFGQSKHDHWSKQKMKQDTVRGYLRSQGFQQLHSPNAIQTKLDIDLDQVASFGTSKDRTHFFGASQLGRP